MPHLDTDHPANGVEPLLGIVIVARNEEPYIRACIESTLHIAADFDSCHVVIVDSRSTDRTIAIACQYAVTVVRIHDGIHCTAALGRAIGQQLTPGQFILFVDGDTQIEPSWVQSAVSLMHDHANIAGVGGKLREVYYRDGTPIGNDADFFDMGDVVEDTYQLGGNALYRRAALDDVGSFDPGIISHEEAELAERLRCAGYRVVRIPLTVGTHHTGPRKALTECWRRFRAGLMIGYGQVLRLSLGTPRIWSHVRELNRHLCWLVFMTVGLIAAVNAASRADWRLLLIWVATAGTVTSALIVRRRDVSMALVVLTEWTLAAPAIVWGFVRGRTAYPNLAPPPVDTVHSADQTPPHFQTSDPRRVVTC